MNNDEYNVKLNELVAELQRTLVDWMERDETNNPIVSVVALSAVLTRQTMLGLSAGVSENLMKMAIAKGAICAQEEPRKLAVVRDIKEAKHENQC